MLILKRFTLHQSFVKTEIIFSLISIVASKQRGRVRASLSGQEERMPEMKKRQKTAAEEEVPHSYLDSIVSNGLWESRSFLLAGHGRALSLFWGEFFGGELLGGEPYPLVTSGDRRGLGANVVSCHLPTMVPRRSISATRGPRKTEAGWICPGSAFPSLTSCGSIFIPGTDTIRLD